MEQCNSSNELSDIAPSNQEIRLLSDKINAAKNENQSRKKSIILRQKMLGKRAKELQKLKMQATENQNIYDKKLIEHDKAKSEVDNLEKKISDINQQTIKAQKRVRHLASSLMQIEKPQVYPLLSQVQERRERVKKIQNQLRQLPQQDLYFSQQIQGHLSTIAKLRESLESTELRIAHLNAIVKAPIDTLEIESALVQDLESFKEPDLIINLSIDDSDVVQLENNNKSRIQELEKRRSSIGSRTISHPPETASNVKYHSIHGAQINVDSSSFEDTISQLSERQSRLESMEKETDQMANGWVEFQDETEDIWQEKLEKIQAMRGILTEIDSLHFSIDEKKNDIYEAKNMLEEYNQELRKARQKAASDERSITFLSQEIEQLHQRTQVLIQRKIELQKKDTVIENRKDRLQGAREQLLQLEELIQEKEDENFEDSKYISGALSAIEMPLEKSIFSDSV